MKENSHAKSRKAGRWITDAIPSLRRQSELVKSTIHWFGIYSFQGSRLTFQLNSLVASERFDFTSQNKFSLARLFLHSLILCSICLIFSRVKYCKNMPLCNLKSEELECWLFFPTVKDPHTWNTKYYVSSGQSQAPLFSISVRSWRITQTELTDKLNYYSGTINYGET